MPDGAVIIAAITSCTNTSNPRNVIAAGLLARNANARGLTRKPWVKTLAGAGLQGRRSCISKKPGCCPNWSSSASASSAFACTTCNGMSRRARSGDPAGNHRARPVRDRRAVRQPQLRRPHPSVREAGVPGLAAAGGRLRDRRHDPLRHREGRAGHRRRRQAGHAQGHLAERRGDRRHRRGEREARAVPQGVRPDVQASASTRRRRSARCTTGARRAPTSAVRRTGKARWPASARSRACVRWRCSATTSPPTTCRRRTRSCWTAPPANTWRRWACRKRTSIPTRRIAATT